MAAALLLTRAELRTRWRALVVLGIFAGLVCGAVLGALLGARRTATAFERLRERTAYWDAEVVGLPPELRDLVAELPAVEAVWEQAVDVGLVTSRDQVTFLAIQAGLERPPGRYDPTVVEGRMWEPTAVDELVVSERAAAVLGVGVGDTFDFVGATPEQFASFMRGVVPSAPEGGRVTFEVVGIVRDPQDALASGMLRLLATPGYERTLGAQSGGLPALTVWLRGGAADLPAFATAVSALVEGAAGDLGEQVEIISVHDERVVVDRATSVAVQALLAFAVAAAAAGLFAVGQALWRDLLVTAPDVATWAAVGATSQERRLARILPRAVVVGVAVVVALGVALALSPLTPVGVGRAVEPSPGVEVSWGLLAAGAVAVAVAVGGLVVGCASRQLRQVARGTPAPARPPSVVARAVVAGGSVPLVVGARFALEPPRGRPSSLPTRSAVAGTVLGVAGLVASGTVLVSLDRLVDTPARFGWGHDVTVADVEDDLVGALVADERHESVVLARQVDVRIGQEEVSAVGLDVVKGGLDLPLLSGRMPGGPGEVALGPVAQERLGVEEGDRMVVAAAGGGDTVLEVVGTVLTEDVEDFGSSAVLTAAGMAALETPDHGYRSAWLTWAEGVDAAAATAALGREREIAVPEAPADIANLSQAMPVVGGLAAFLAALALAATGHAVLVTTARRRQELGVLWALGLTGRQLARAVRWMALVFLGVGLVVGIPSGVVAAGLVWGRVAAGAGVAPDLAVPAAALLVVVPAAGALGLVLAAGPASRAARLGAAGALRAE